MGALVGLGILVGVIGMGISHEDHDADPPVYTPIFFVAIGFLCFALVAGITWIVVGVLGSTGGRNWFENVSSMGK